jgi:hypothetical protein
MLKSSVVSILWHAEAHGVMVNNYVGWRLWPVSRSTFVNIQHKHYGGMSDGFCGRVCYKGRQTHQSTVELIINSAHVSYRNSAYASDFCVVDYGSIPYFAGDNKTVPASNSELADHTSAPQ